jgi:hypothetical protein
MAFRRMIDPSDHVQQSGFPTAGFTNDGNEFAAIDGQVHAFENGELTRRIAESFDKTA